MERNTSFKNTKISEIIEQLIKYQKEFGDLEVVGWSDAFNDYVCKGEIELISYKEKAIIFNESESDEMKNYLAFKFKSGFLKKKLSLF